MFSPKSSPYISILLHLFLWSLFAFVLLFYQPLTWNIAVPYQFWIKQGILLTFLIAVFYFNSYILVPALLLKNRNVVFILIILALAILTGPFIKAIDSLLGLPALMNHAFNKIGNARLPKRNNTLDVFSTMMTLFMAGISTSVTLIEKWQADRREREAMEKERIGTELLFLKAQINPHFFFNTLNNIYALTHVDIEKSRKALHQLSRMMRYLLYETQAGSTPLSKEVAFITDYIQLMQLRLNEFTTINYVEPKLISDPQIAPMLFLPYIENAFKYGVSTTAPAIIDLEFTQKGNRLSMRIKNAILKANHQEDGYGGIGLSNTKRRLDLLYPGRYTLTAGESVDGQTFIVHLNIQFDDTELHSG